MKDNLVEEQIGLPIVVDNYERYDQTKLSVLFHEISDKFEDAKSSGYKDIWVTFNSTIAPYEEYPGCVEIEINGLREKTEAEKSLERDQKRLVKLAAKLGISFYEASVVDRLEKVGKVKV